MAVDLTVQPRHWQPGLRLADGWRRWLPLRFLMARQTDKPGESEAKTPSATDVDAFYELFARYQKPIADFLYRMTHDRDWAADLTQDTFLKAYAHLEDLKTITNVRAWLYRIAANTASNALRHQRRFAWVSLTEMRTGDSSSSSGQGGAGVERRRGDKRGGTRRADERAAKLATGGTRRAFATCDRRLRSARDRDDAEYH
jgi:RNA polymerase sigma factor (sigma-70 family)